MSEPVICLSCAKKYCYSTAVGTLDICEYGIATYKSPDQLFKKEALVPFHQLSQNLRHELNRVLNIIVEEVLKIDKTISSKHLDVSIPSNRIFAATKIIDNFVTMISGINTFHPSSMSGLHLAKQGYLKEIINKYFSIYSIIKNPRRSDHLSLITKDIDLTITFGVDFIEYLVSILMDNIWKYSLPHSPVNVWTSLTKPNLAVIYFANLYKSKIPDSMDIFGRGTKADMKSDGYGYGLFWGRILVDHYNSLGNIETDQLSLTHTQEQIDEDTWQHTFILSNVICSKENK